MKVFLALAICASILGVACADDSMVLRDVKSLTFFKGRMTTARRSYAIQQLQCVGGDACEFKTPEVVSCKNIGFDGRSVQWKCSATIEDYYRLGTTTVSCEGFSRAGDSNVLIGSCGLKYTLHLTEKGRRHHYPPRTVVDNRFNMRPPMVTVKPPVNAHRPVIVRTTSNNNESTGAFVAVLGLMVVMCVGVVVCSLPSRPPSVSSYDPSHVRHVVEETTYQSVDPPQASAPYYDVPVAPPPPPPMYHQQDRDPDMKRPRQRCIAK